MQRTDSKTAGKFDSGEVTERLVGGRSSRWGLRLVGSAILRGPEKYRLLDLKRRRAQIRARRELELI
jgi:hypothetical protein